MNNNGREVKIETFIGEFSNQWVGVRRVNGQIEHSVQRASKSLAEFAVKQTNPDAPRFVN